VSRSELIVDSCENMKRLLRMNSRGYGKNGGGFKRKWLLHIIWDFRAVWTSLQMLTEVSQQGLQ
jgi:hypothetical protein